MSNSVLLCISTLLESGNHYSKMFDLTDSLGRKLFESIAITLVCADCLATDHPERCTHKLAEMPVSATLPARLSRSKLSQVFCFAEMVVKHQDGEHFGPLACNGHPFATP